MLTVNHLDQPALDPLGLTQAQFALGPRQTAQVAIDFNTRKEQTQSQLGLHWRHAFDAGALREFTLAGYGGTRAITQWLAIPAGTQGNPRHGGGVVALDHPHPRCERARLQPVVELGGIGARRGRTGQAGDGQRQHSGDDRPHGLAHHGSWLAMRLPLLSAPVTVTPPVGGCAKSNENTGFSLTGSKACSRASSRPLPSRTDRRLT